MTMAWCSRPAAEEAEGRLQSQFVRDDIRPSQLGNLRAVMERYLRTPDPRALLAAQPEVGLIEAKPTACQPPRPTRPDKKAVKSEEASREG